MNDQSYLVLKLHALHSNSSMFALIADEEPDAPPSRLLHQSPNQGIIVSKSIYCYIDWIITLGLQTEAAAARHAAGTLLKAKVCI